MAIETFFICRRYIHYVIVSMTNMAYAMKLYRETNMLNPCWIREQPAGCGASRLRKIVIVVKKGLIP